MKRTQLMRPDEVQAFTAQHHVITWLNGEQSRIQAELAHVQSQLARAQAGLVSWLQQTYGADPAHHLIRVDPAQSAIEIDTPDEPPAEPPAEETAEEPAEEPAEAPAEEQQT